MPRAEVGSNKYIANKMKSKGLQRLRWYCQICEKQCRDENGFKCHTQSESHVRQMHAVGSNAKSVIEDYSRQFLRDFVQQLRVSHHTKAVHINHFYQEYIANKEHIHMNATKWPNLTEFAKHLGREGLCRVEETDKGLHIAWVDNSPEAVRRKEEKRRQEALEKGDEQREHRELREQMNRAKQQMAAIRDDRTDEPRDEVKRPEGEKIVFSLGGPKKLPTPPQSDGGDETEQKGEKDSSATTPPAEVDGEAKPEPAKSMGFSFSAGGNGKPQNIMSLKRKERKEAKVSQAKDEGVKKMSKAEEIMRNEMERKRPASSIGGTGIGFSLKKQRIAG